MLLWGCKCRSGKTYMFGGLIINQFEIKQKLNVLIITQHQQKQHHNLRMTYLTNLKSLNHSKYIILMDLK